MNRTGLALLVILLSSAGAAGGGAPVRSPLVGHWVLQVDKLTMMPPEARPKRVDLEFAEAADGRWNSRVQIVDQADHELHSESTLSLDGTPGMSSGTYWVDVGAATMPAPGVLVMQFAWHGQPSSTRIYTVGEDGKTLTETEAFFRKDGAPAMRIAYFSRAS
jgi:hypothetical protein